MFNFREMVSQVLRRKKIADTPKPQTTPDKGVTIANLKPSRLRLNEPPEKWQLLRAMASGRYQAGFKRSNSHPRPDGEIVKKRRLKQLLNKATV